MKKHSNAKQATAPQAKNKEQNAKQSIKIIIKNKRAFFEYEVLSRYECGIMLLGPEVKSIREQKVQFADSFARLKDGVISMHNMHISPYKFYTAEQIDSVRVRKLLLKKDELKKIKRQVEEKGHTLIPLSLYLKNGLIKLELGVCKGKKLYDKKETLKAKTLAREAQQEAKTMIRS